MQTRTTWRRQASDLRELATELRLATIPLTEPEAQELARKLAARFSVKVPTVVFVDRIDDSRSDCTRGDYTISTRTIRLSKENGPGLNGQNVGVLCHEMGHVLVPEDGNKHSPRWLQACERVVQALGTLAKK